MSDRSQGSVKNRWKVIKEFGKIKGKARGMTPFRPTKEVRISPKFFDILEEFQSGNSFKQEDVPLIRDDKEDRKISSGGFRFYGTQRNLYDVCRAKHPAVDEEKKTKDYHDTSILTTPSTSKQAIKEFGIIKEKSRGTTPFRPTKEVRIPSAKIRTEDRTTEERDRSEHSFISSDDMYEPELQRFMPRSTGFTAEDDLRDAYYYDTTSTFPEWKMHARAIPEYENWTKREDFLKQGAVRSDFDYENLRPRGLSVDLQLYDRHPEFQSVVITREYRKPGTIRNPFDYDGDVTEYRRIPTSIPKQHVHRIIPKSSERNRVKFSGNIQKTTGTFGKQYLNHKEIPFSRRNYEERNQLKEVNEESYQKRKGNPSSREDYEEQNRLNEERFRQLQENISSREDYEEQNRLNEERYREREGNPSSREDYEEQNRLREKRFRNPSASSSRLISRQVPPETQGRIQKYRNMADVKSLQKEFSPRMNCAPAPWKEQLLSNNMAMHHSHPDDYGTSHHSEHEEFTKKDGKQIYIKSQESFSHIHHIGDEE